MKRSTELPSGQPPPRGFHLYCGGITWPVPGKKDGGKQRRTWSWPVLMAARAIQSWGPCIRLLPTHASSGPVLVKTGSPLKVQLSAQVQAGLWCNHTVQFAYSADFGLDIATPRESQMPLLPAASCSTCLCTIEILLLTKSLKIRDTTVPDSYLDACNPMKSVRTQDLIWVKNLNTSVELDLNSNPWRG